MYIIILSHSCLTFIIVRLRPNTNTQDNGSSTRLSSRIHVHLNSETAAYFGKLSTLFISYNKLSCINNYLKQSTYIYNIIKILNTLRALKLRSKHIQKNLNSFLDILYLTGHLRSHYTRNHRIGTKSNTLTSSVFFVTSLFY